MSDLPAWLQLLIYVCFVILPAIIMLAGCGMLARVWRFRQACETVTGTVVEIITHRHFGSGRAETLYYQPSFEFSAPDGSTLRALAASCGVNMQYPIGSTREILVNFNAPKEVQLDGCRSGIITGAACVLIGGGILALGLYFVISW
ncbi:DUF3592 domain-containing protein [Pararhodobacter oceanensis]|uniref:DUF3592 domain-containing protein n=1 Tax=Pararhodobacter oceanensis TaxID=2172121 RepID=A0A2T8HX92_9RHOB|nr:DUF3592 domain-containing protein [Pararhodobacter oceanensis]PVH30028.1 hypothetical protein DDE20_00115 [Pararhodobacter oceanensis]